MKNSYITVTDQFCGAGGSSQGVRNFSEKVGGGIEVKLAMNHWKLAIETHATNFPEADHDCADISASDPRRYSSTDILITSPECTNHSVSNGKKKPKSQIDLFDKGILDPAAERSRATMWDVVRFAEYHKYNVIITENVVDARKWILYDAWINAMHNLGYNHKCCFLNSMHFWPTPQSRDRMYVVFWKKGNKMPDLNYMPLANCPKCDCNINAIQSWKPKQKSWKYKTGYVYCCPKCSTIVDPYYYAAFNCIDWTMPGKKISERKKPLEGNTERRIRKGIEMFKDYPFLLTTAYDGLENRIYDLKNASPTFTTQLNNGIFQPFIINNQQSDNGDSRIKASMQDVLNTASTYANFGMIAPAPLIINGHHAKSESGSYIRPVDGRHHNQGLVMMPVIIENKGTSTCRAADEALSTFTTTLSHGILSKESFQSFLTYYNGGSDVCSHVTQAAGVFPTNDRHGIVSYKETQYEDCYYRTLKHHEVQRGMAFADDYIVLGDSKSKVKQLGNAVTPPVMEWLIKQSVESLEGAA